MEREHLLKQLTVLDFMAVDLCMFLDTHTDNREALEKYNSVIMQADQIRAEYEKKYGPLCSYRSLNKNCWQWPEDPWPWCKSFNFELCGCEEEKA